MLCGLRKKKPDTEDTGVEKKNKNVPERSKKRRKSRSQEEEITSFEVEKSKLRSQVEGLRAQISDLSLKLELATNQLSIIINENETLKRYNRELQENNRVCTKLLDNLQIKYGESSIQIDSYQEQVKQLTQSETCLHMRLAELEALVANSEKENARLEKTLKVFEVETGNYHTMQKVVGLQEKLLVEKTQQILALETSITALAGKLEVEMRNLQDIPDSISSNTLDLKQCISGTIDRLHHSLEKSSKQTLQKMDALQNAWERFQELDTQLESPMDEDDLVKIYIPAWLKTVAQRLSYTLGPNWLDAGRLLGLDGDELEGICEDWGQYGMQELALRVLETWCSKTPETHLTLAELQKAMGQMEINPLLLDPMSPHDQEILVCNYQKLVDDLMDVPIIEGHLRQERVLSASAVSYVLDPRTRNGRIRRLLKVLAFSGSRALPVLRDALMNTKQNYLAMALTGERGLEADGCLERNLTRDFLDEHTEIELAKDEQKLDTLAELQTYLLRVSAETKKEVLLVREHMERDVFKSNVKEMERKMSRAPSCDVKWSKTM